MNPRYKASIERSNAAIHRIGKTSNPTAPQIIGACLVGLLAGFAMYLGFLFQLSGGWR